MVTERWHGTKMGMVFVLLVFDLLYLVDGAWWSVNGGRGSDSAITTSTDSEALYYKMYGPMMPN